MTRSLLAPAHDARCGARIRRPRGVRYTVTLPAHVSAGWGAREAAAHSAGVRGTHSPWLDDQRAEVGYDAILLGPRKSIRRELQPQLPHAAGRLASQVVDAAVAQGVTQRVTQRVPQVMLLDPQHL